MGGFLLLAYFFRTANMVVPAEVRKPVMGHCTPRALGAGFWWVVTFGGKPERKRA